MSNSQIEPMPKEICCANNLITFSYIEKFHALTFPFSLK